MKNVIIVLLLIALGISLFYLHQNVVKRRELAEAVVGMGWIRELSAYDFAQRNRMAYMSYEMPYTVIKDYKKPFKYMTEGKRKQIIAYYLANMADCQYAMGNYEKALGFINNALNSGDLSYYSDMKDWLLLYKSKTLYKLNRVDEADKIFAELKDKNFNAYIDMAEIYLKKDNVEKANEILKKATDNYEKHLVFAKHYYEKKDYDKANEFIDKGIASIDKEQLNLKGEFAFYLETFYLMKSAIGYEKKNIALAKKYYDKAASITTYSKQKFTKWIAGRELSKNTVNELQKIKELS